MQGIREGVFNSQMFFYFSVICFKLKWFTPEFGRNRRRISKRKVLIALAERQILHITIKSSLFQLGKHVSVGQSHLRFNLFVEANSPCNQEHKTKTLFLSWTWPSFQIRRYSKHVSPFYNCHRTTDLDFFRHFACKVYNDTSDRNLLIKICHVI